MADVYDSNKTVIPVIPSKQNRDGTVWGELRKTKIQIVQVVIDFKSHMMYVCGSSEVQLCYVLLKPTWPSPSLLKRAKKKSYQNREKNQMFTVLLEVYIP